jgi:hypothetical protein
MKEYVPLYLKLRGRDMKNEIRRNLMQYLQSFKSCCCIDVFIIFKK